ncbi:hypothetical protein ACIGNX_19085 [Actinosynnema sp. NPDC053489]|uniref:hypothetical protein n=1 Tax=Actinosynnema sp. NPDC053489 TaxID=3363916 RepID=UPI0037CB13ED
MRDLISGDRGEAGRRVRAPGGRARPGRAAVPRPAAPAVEVGAAHHEVVPHDSEDNALRRFAERGTVRATPAELAAVHDAPGTITATRSPQVIASVEGDPEGAHESLPAVLSVELGGRERTTHEP